MEQDYGSIDTASRNLLVSLAKGEDEIRAAQRLRYEVFALECGARLRSLEPGIDADEFDDFCEHLIVRDRTTDTVVGTYRILTSWKAKQCGSFYSESEFDLCNLKPLVPRVVEVGRSCIRQGYRQGAVITLLWSGLAQYMITRGYEYLMGCASISLNDGGCSASTVYLSLRERSLSPEYWRVYPWTPFTVRTANCDRSSPLPPLMALQAFVWVASGSAGGWCGLR
jgi:putative hemolysin